MWLGSQETILRIECFPLWAGPRKSYCYKHFTDIIIKKCLIITIEFCFKIQDWDLPISNNEVFYWKILLFESGSGMWWISYVKIHLVAFKEITVTPKQVNHNKMGGWRNGCKKTVIFNCLQQPKYKILKLISCFELITFY